jgi:hypothetical protein
VTFKFKRLARQITSFGRLMLAPMRKTARFKALMRKRLASSTPGASGAGPISADPWAQTISSAISQGHAFFRRG